MSLVLIEIEQLQQFIKEAVNAGIQGIIPYPSPKVDTKKVYTRNEVAAMLHKTPNTISKYIKQGRLYATCLNGQYLINEKELHRFIESKQK